MTRPSRMAVRTHRGAVGGPEHSKPGIQNAGTWCGSFEIDIVGSYPDPATGLNAAVCLHDNNLAVQTNGTDLASDYLLPSLRQFRFTAYGGQYPILTLEEYLDATLDFRGQYFIEPKVNDAPTLAAIGRALSSRRVPPARVTFLSWTASKAQILAGCPGYEACRFSQGVYGDRPTAMAPGVLDGIKAAGYDEVSFWPLNHTQEDYDLMAGEDLMLAYYANGGTNNDLWLETATKGTPSYFMSDATTLDAQIQSYYAGWSSLHRVTNETDLNQKLLPGGAYTRGVTYYAEAGVAQMWINPMSVLSSCRFWWHQPMKSNDGGQTWAAIPRADVLSYDRGYETASNPSDREVMTVRLTQAGQLTRLWCKVLPIAWT